jgi:hypothetical protein
VYKWFAIKFGCIILGLLVVILPHCPSFVQIKSLASRFLFYVCWGFVAARFYLSRSAADLRWLIFYFDLQERRISLVWTAEMLDIVGDFCCVCLQRPATVGSIPYLLQALLLQWLCASEVVPFLVWSIACWLEGPMCYTVLYTHCRSLSSIRIYLLKKGIC